jgi:exopolysaccharide production protein ExoQ
MSTLASPQPAFTAIRPKPLVSAPGSSIFPLLLTYALLLPMIFLTARGAFSFEATGYNSSAGGVANPDQGSGSAAHSLEIIVCYSIMLLAIFPVWKKYNRAVMENLPLLALPVWAMLSTLWSSDPIKSISFGTLALIITLFGIYLPVRFTPRQQMQLFLITGIVATVASLVLVVGMPKAGIDHKNASIGFQGIYPQKNICSVTTIALMMAAFFYKFTGLTAGIKRAAYLGLAFVLVVGTTARTGFILLGLVVLFTLVLKGLHRMGPIERVLLTVFLPLVGLVSAAMVYINRVPILKFLGKDATLSGRTGIWSVVFLSIVKRPLTGFGYAGFWTLKNPEAARLALAVGDPKLTNAENGVLQLCLELGLVGVVILLVLLARATRNGFVCYRSNTPNYAMWYMTIIFITLLALVDGSKFMHPTSIDWVMFVMADIGLAQEAKRVRSARTTWA